jgi:hypothetical protein
MNNINWMAVLRNVAIVFGLTFVAGFIVGLISQIQKAPLNLPLLGLVNIFMITLGFFICGCLTPVKRWPTLLLTVVGVWLASIMNIFLGAATVPTWIASFFVCGIFALLGGGLSTLVVPESRPPTQPPLQ